MFLHVLYSWLITQIFHPLLFLISLCGLHGWFSVQAEDIFYFILLSAVVSLPCLLLGWLCIGIIVHSNYTTTARFFIWLATAGMLVILNLWMIILFIHIGFQFRDFLIAIPGIISIWIASVIRIKQFQKLCMTENRLLEAEISFETNNENINH